MTGGFVMSGEASIMSGWGGRRVTELRQRMAEGGRVQASLAEAVSPPNPAQAALE